MVEVEKGKIINVFEVEIKFIMQEESLWEVWEKLNASNFRPFRKVEIKFKEDFEVGNLSEKVENPIK